MTARTKAESPPPLDIVLKNLVERRTELDKLDDKLSALIRRIESVLQKQVSTRITRVIGEDEERIECLTFGKHEGRFMLLIESGFVDRDGEIAINNCTPLLSTSRETRTFVFAEGHVEQLIRSAHEQFSQQIVMRVKALAAAEQIANALGSFSVSVIEDSTPSPSTSISTSSDPSPDDDIPF